MGDKNWKKITLSHLYLGGKKIGIDNKNCKFSSLFLTFNTKETKWLKIACWSRNKITLYYAVIKMEIWMEIA